MARSTRRAVMSYAQAIDHVLMNDDTSCLDDPRGHASVTMSMVADFYDVPTEECLADFRKRQRLMDELKELKGYERQQR